MKTVKAFPFLFVVGFATVTGSVSAQVGDDNNTGTSGYFQGEVTTGCAYNAYTGSISRTVTDISVAGAVGYPLAFTRTSTSRYTAGSKAAMEFGKPGSWLHSYGWNIEPYTGSHPGWPTKFIVNYPDGRRVTFTNYSDAYVLPPPGVSGIIDLDPNATATQGHVWLWLPDGGKVQFKVAISNNRTNYVYTAESISDPYGQVMTIARSGTVTTVTEPAGRMLKIFYGTGPASDNVITGVEEWMTSTQKGRTVSYNYSLYTAGGAKYSALTSVSYLNVDGSVYATAAYTYQNDNLSATGRPLLSSANDPMYAGPMRKIQYSYTPAGSNADGTKVVSGQIQSEKSGTTGQAVSTLTISTDGRGETTGDGRTRTFKFVAGGLVDSYTDFRGKTTSYIYEDGTGMPTKVVDRNQHTWNHSYNSYTRTMIGRLFPLTPNDTPPHTPQTGIWTDLGGINCPDPNNRDWYHAFYPYSVTNQAADNVTIFLRDANKRIVQVNYPDGGTESFTYNSFGQVLTHRLRAGGLETFTYDSRGLLTEYRDAYHLATADPQNPNVPTSATPSVTYGYDSLDRVSAVADALASSTTDANHTTNYAYNWRGEVTTTTLSIDPIDSQRHTIINAYNDADGTLSSVTDQLNHATSYTYDDYRRVRTVTTPGHNTPLTSQLFYDANGTGDDYTHTDANVTYAKSPSAKKLITAYDENKRKISVTAMGANGEDPATTTFGYDDNGNLTSVVSPNEQPGQLYAGKSSVTIYDERNRPMSITDALNNPTTFMYDGAGRKASITRANGQVITFDRYDSMRRLLQQTVQQAPNPDAVTKYSYYNSGLLHTMQDPQLVANNSNYAYTYSYDLMGRKTGLNYPPDSGNVQRNELWHYDTNGRNDTFTNRNGNTQRTLFDNLSRAYNVGWDDGGTTPTVTYGYDVGSRLTSITNTNSTISRVLFNDGLLNTETTTYADNTPRTVSYSYDADSNRATIQYPNGAYSFGYSYTGRNQLWKLLNGDSPIATYGYDPDGNLISRAPDNSTHSNFAYDALDRVTQISHALTGTTRTFDYAYDSVGNRKWAKRDGGTGDVFGYDLNDQSIAILLDVSNPDSTSPGAQTINYDAGGNRTTFAAYGTSDSYHTNELNQYTSRTSGGTTDTAIYDANGNLTSFGRSGYSYDAQNRLLTTTKGASGNYQFAYDGLNRRVKTMVKFGLQGWRTSYQVYDGWNLIGSYDSAATVPSEAYLTGPGGVVKNLVDNRYYYQDAAGSTSHLADNNGNLLEWYRYDLQGTPIFYDSLNNQRSTSNYSVRHLFTGQQWYGDIGLYDLRNRFYSPDIGRFLQADPLRFAGDPTNLYRYIGNNPVNLADPLGLYWPYAPPINTGLFWTGVQNAGLGVLSIAAIAVADTYSGGTATVPTAIFLSSGIVSTSTGLTQIGESIFGTAQEQQFAADLPTNSSGLLAMSLPRQAGNVLQSAEAAFTGVSAIQSAMAGERGLLSLASAASDLASSATYVKNAWDAAAVEQELAAAANTFKDPSLARNFSNGVGPFNGVDAPLANFQISGLMGYSGLSAFGFGSVSFPGTFGLGTYTFYGSPLWNSTYYSWGVGVYTNGGWSWSWGYGGGGGGQQDDPNKKKKPK